MNGKKAKALRRKALAGGERYPRKTYQKLKKDAKRARAHTGHN